MELNLIHIRAIQDCFHESKNYFLKLACLQERQMILIKQTVKNQSQEKTVMPNFLSGSTYVCFVSKGRGSLAKLELSFLITNERHHIFFTFFDSLPPLNYASDVLFAFCLLFV